MPDVPSRDPSGQLEPVNRGVDLRAGYRIQVVPTLLPRGQWSATLHERREGPRTTYKQVGPHVLAASPEAAARDLLAAINEGLLPGVEISA